MSRQDQIVSVLHRAVQNVLTEGLGDPRVRGLVSVTEVRVSPDLANATVMVSILPVEHETLTMHGLRAASAHVRSQLSRRVDLRRIPDITFKLDRSLKKAADLHAAIGSNADAEDGDGTDSTPATEHEETDR